MFVWICPNILRDDNCLKNKLEVKEHIEKSFESLSRLGV